MDFMLEKIFKLKQNNTNVKTEVIAGICMLVFPTSVTGIILITLSAGSALANYIGYRKLEKL